MEEDKHAIVRALHEYDEYGPTARAATTTTTATATATGGGGKGGRGRIDMGEFVEGERYPKPDWPRALWRRARPAATAAAAPRTGDATAEEEDEDEEEEEEEGQGGFELIYSEQQRRCEGRLLQQRDEDETINPCKHPQPFT